MSIQQIKLRPARKTSVRVAILTGRERTHWIHPDLLNVCMAMIFWQRETGSGLSTSTVNGVVPVDAARNVAVKEFMDSGFEWLLQIDNDVVPPSNVLSVLDDVGYRKIIGLPCGIEKMPGDLTLALGNKAQNNNAGEPYESYRGLPAGWVPIDIVGTGCIFVHRDVFASIGHPWFECTIRGAAHTGEDFGFCEKAAAKGFRVWTHSGFPCAHYKTVDLTQHMVARHGPLINF
jgi:hypothetical protein